MVVGPINEKQRGRWRVTDGYNGSTNAFSLCLEAATYQDSPLGG